VKILEQIWKNIEGLGKLVKPVELFEMLIKYFFVSILRERNVGLDPICPLVNAVFNLKRIRSNLRYK
jgi:hypothetical protein